jgi:exodeoxyribonuclease VII large subunit
MEWINIIINGKEVSVAFDENSIHIYNAFPIKDDLKLLGYRWNPEDKSWYISPEDVDYEIEVLKNNLESKPDIERVYPESELSKFPKSMSVVELRNQIDQLIKRGIGGQIWIRGLVASDIKNYKWASYFDLKDENENIDIFFKVEVKKKDLEIINHKLNESGASETIEKDLPVFCLVEVYLPLKNMVDIRLKLLDILPEYTQSKIRNQREITIEKLKDEGILEKQKKMLLPLLIYRIGVITSEQGTSIEDIMAGLHPYEGKYNLFFVDSRMQGSNAVESILNAIDFLENNPKIPLDAIIIARGGGSEQSLAIFNDYKICQRVCCCKIPIITAIGHEKDVSAIEICSFFTPAPSTPSGIGKYLKDRYVSLQDQLIDSIYKLINCFSNVHNREVEKINSFLRNIPSIVLSILRLIEERFFSIARLMGQLVYFTVRDHKRRINSFVRQLVYKAESLNNREEKQIKKIILGVDFHKRNKENIKFVEKIKDLSKTGLNLSLTAISDEEKAIKSRRDLVYANDPERILEKGFTLTLDEKNRIIKSIKEFKKIDFPKLKFNDGIIKIKERRGK